MCSLSFPGSRPLDEPIRERGETKLANNRFLIFFLSHKNQTFHFVFSEFVSLFANGTKI